MVHLLLKYWYTAPRCLSYKKRQNEGTCIFSTVKMKMSGKSWRERERDGGGAGGVSRRFAKHHNSLTPTTAPGYHRRASNRQQAAKSVLTQLVPVSARETASRVVLRLLWLAVLSVCVCEQDIRMCLYLCIFTQWTNSQPAYKSITCIYGMFLVRRNTWWYVLLSYHIYFFCLNTYYCY